MELNIYQGKKILITGHTGFKGSWLAPMLKQLGAYVFGISNTRPFNLGALNKTTPSLSKQFDCDIRDISNINNIIDEIKPDIIFHLAAQSLVSTSYQDPFETYTTNVIGTLNLLEAFKKSTTATAFVNITTDKCYKNLENGVSHKETDAFGGHDPYSASKACVEIMSESFVKSFLKEDKFVANLRSGNVIGGGDWCEDRLIPDIMRSYMSSTAIQIRSPESVRPWQHVLDPLYGYILIGKELLLGNRNIARAWNFGPIDSDHYSVSDVVEKIQTDINFTVEYDKLDNFHETKILKLDCSDANKILDWKPLLTGDQMFSWTSDWYKSMIDDQVNITRDQIKNYLNLRKRP